MTTSPRLRGRWAGIGAAALIVCSPMLVPGTADAARALPCHARMSDSTPKQYTTTFVKVKTAPRARVRTVAHYKTTNTAHRARANAAGRASVGYNISDATPGRRVPVTVTVTKRNRVGHCSTSFRPHR
jgi:hypothetical protein